MMKRIGIWLLVMALAVSFAGCKEKEMLPQEITGEVYDAGQFQVFVPVPWKVLPVTDLSGQVKTDGVFLRKGGESDWKVTEKPYIRIDCYGAGEWENQPPDESLYRNVEQLPPMELGGLLWEGYTADNYQGKAKIGSQAVLWTEDGIYTYQVLVWFKSGGDSISLDDGDVQAILAGVSAAKE